MVLLVRFLSCSAEFLSGVSEKMREGIMVTECIYRVETRLSIDDDRMIISFRHTEISVSRSADPPCEHVAMEARVHPCLVQHTRSTEGITGRRNTGG